MLLSKAMGAYQLGEVYARNMGVNIRQFRIELILLSSILSATVTAFAGPVSFVGIAVPHVIKQLFKTAKPIVVIPGCFLGGASFCLFSDLLARTLFSPTELSISSIDCGIRCAGGDRHDDKKSGTLRKENICRPI